VLTYCDSSALVVLLRPDEGHRESLVTEAVRDATDVAGCEWICPLEVTAVIHRSLRAQRRSEAEKRWWDIWSRMVPVALDGRLYEAALDASRKHRLRSLDALHLGAALRIGCGRLLTFDQELATAARAERIAVVGA
jgi:predicted nucleic acid-binding protein